MSVKLRKGGLRPIELAGSAVLAAAAAAVVAVGSLLPRAGALELLAAVPLAVVARHYGARAAVGAAVAGSISAFVVAGFTAGAAVMACSVMGGVVGSVARRGGSWPTVLAFSAVIGPVCGAVADLVLLVFSGARDLTFAAVRSLVVGLARIAEPVAFLSVSPARVGPVVDALLASWPWWVFFGIVAFMPVGMLTVWWILAAVLSRLDWIRVVDPLDPLTDETAPQGDGGAGPLPLELRDVRYRYPGGDHEALRGVSLRLEPGEFTVLSGPNGSGKSSLVRVIAGATVTGGTVIRPGEPGLGRVGGTALVLQRPETQVLGMTVAEDLDWGLPREFHADKGAVLAAVGLTGMEDRATASLSGGQLQRLAIAAALIRRPRLLISDESTAMVDAAGRNSLLNLLASLPARFDMSVLHVTHAHNEAFRADRTIAMTGGRITSDGPPAPPDPGPATPAFTTAAPVTPVPGPSPQTGVILRVRGVRHTHADRSPWAHQALKEVNLTLHEGDGVLISGANGSGKSTLAWILAGLLTPTEGSCLLDGEPVTDRTGSVALAFQHARLQLQRPTVALDILAAAGRAPRRGRPLTAGDREFAASALDTVGLPPGLADRSIDALSGGQQRRVALAGLIASRPRVLVLDEPLAGLDPGSRLQLSETLASLRTREKLSLVVISHDVETLARACPRTAVLRNGVLECAG